EHGRGRGGEAEHSREPDAAKAGVAHALPDEGHALEDHDHAQHRADQRDHHQRDRAGKVEVGHRAKEILERAHGASPPPGLAIESPFSPGPGGAGWTHAAVCGCGWSAQAWPARVWAAWVWS